MKAPPEPGRVTRSQRSDESTPQLPFSDTQGNEAPYAGLRNRLAGPDPKRQVWGCSKVWRLPADVETEQIAPASMPGCKLTMAARHCLETLRPEFATEVQPGDVIVAGANFGIGGSSEPAAAVLAHLGVASVIAPSFAGQFFRDAFNAGLLLLTCPQAVLIDDGEMLEFDARAARVQRTTPGLPLAVFECEPVAELLLELVEAGGLHAQLKKRRNKV